MGAWGYGPFDSDAALDALAELAAAVAPGTDSDQLHPEHINQQLVTQSTLDMLTDRRAGLEAQVYAAAGLVAAALTGAGHTPGTSLFTDQPDDWSRYHCGYARLLSPATAGRLATEAADAVDWLAGCQQWIAGWNDPDDLRDILADVQQICGNSPTLPPPD